MTQQFQFGKDIISANTSDITIEKGKTFDVDACVDYFNLFTDKTAELTYETLDSDIAEIYSGTGILTAIKERKNYSLCQRSRNRQNMCDTCQSIRKQRHRAYGKNKPEVIP